MKSKHLLILGGYGSTGFPIANHLLAQTDLCITLAGRNLEKARDAAEKLNAVHSGNRAHAITADASDGISLHHAFEGMDMVVVASSTSGFAGTVARSALDAGIDYLDTQYSTIKTRILQDLEPEIERAGCCFITDSGFHPGMPAAMVRFAAEHFDSLESANIGSVIKIDWSALDLSPATMEEFIGEFMNFQTLRFKDGRWQTMSALAMMMPNFMDFGGEFGRQYCIPMFLEEMRPLPDMYPSLLETGFFVGSLNWFVDWFLSPIILFGLKLFPKAGLMPMGRLMYWGLKTFSSPPYGTLLKLEAKGMRNNKSRSMNMMISHADGYALTAIPVTACLMQYLNGNHKPGLWQQAHFVEPKRFFEDIEKMGAEIRIS